jgi:Na+/H+-dicarboxylate symporter
MFSILKKHLAGLTLFGLGFGLLLGFAVGGRTLPKKLSEDNFIREVERGKGMPVIVRSAGLREMAAGDSGLLPRIGTGNPLLLSDADIDVPDADAEPFLGCQEDGDVFFAGTVETKTEAYLSAARPGAVSSAAAPGTRASVLITLTGTLSKCALDKKGKMLKSDLARGVPLKIILRGEAGKACRFTSIVAVATYFDFVGNMFITFLLMLFIPTLALALVRAVLDSAGALRKFGPAFVFFAVSSTAASAIGAVCGLILAGLPTDLDKQQVQNLAQAFGGHPESPSYDPHPFLTQLGRIVPTNPIGALSDPTGNSGLQIAFIAIVLGAVLATVNEASRKTISASLKKTLSVFIKDHELPNRAVSDYAEWVGPIGVFFLAMSTGSKMNMETLQDLGCLGAAVILGLVGFVVLSLLWLRLFRDWDDWYESGLRPALGGLVTAFATSSSYSALPQVSSIPMVSRDSLKRGVLDFGITLNKSGTALYIGAAGGFMLARFGNSSPLAVALMVMLCGVASTACAGLPFAAVFALRMVLMASGTLGGLAWFILPIDPVLDRFVTAVNVFTNVCACSDPKVRRGAVVLSLSASGD